MQRAIKRSKIPVWYSQGFNPHIYLNFPLALSLGVAGSNEFMDFSVTESIDFVRARDMLNGAMPEGLKIVSVSEPVFANKDIGFAEYVVDFRGGASSSETLKALDDMMSMDTVEVEKHSKSKGTVKLDIRPYLDIIKTETAENSLIVYIRLPAGLSLNINSNVFADAFSEISGITFDNIYAERTKILLKNGENFV